MHWICVHYQPVLLTNQAASGGKAAVHILFMMSHISASTYKNQLLAAYRHVLATLLINWNDDLCGTCCHSVDCLKTPLMATGHLMSFVAGLWSSGQLLVWSHEMIEPADCHVSNITDKMFTYPKQILAL